MNISKGESGIPAIITGRIASFAAADNAAASVTLQSVPIPGTGDQSCVPGDIIFVRPRTHIANLMWGPGSCTVAGTALIPVTNPTAGAINPAAAAYDFMIVRTSAD